MARRRDAQFAILLTFIFGFEVASSQFMSFYGNKLTIKPDNDVVCNDDLECIENSCNEARVCRRLSNRFVQYGIMTCDENSDTPYCNDGLCSKTPRVGCEPIPFLCPADGVYPDPTNCSRYHICADGVVTTNQCPSKNVYDHVTGGCKYNKKAAKCVPFNCVGREGRPVVYQEDQSIYGICLLGAALILGRCENYEIYNLTQERCVRHCKTGGLQPSDPGSDSCRKYILCAEVSPKTYEPVEMSCACNEGFDKVKNRCTVDAPCLAEISEPLCPKDPYDNNDNYSEGNSEDNDSKITTPLITNNFNNSNNNNVSNDDGNLTDDNNDGDNSNSENATNNNSTESPSNIDNPEGNNSDNISSGDDNHDENLINGNGNSNSTDVANNDPIDDNTGKKDTNNSAKSDDENSTNSNDDGENSNSDNIANGDSDGKSNENNNANNPVVSPPAIDNSDDNENHDVVDDNENNNDDKDNSDNANSDKSTIEKPEATSITVDTFIRIFIDWIIRVIVGQPAVS